jgi:hypothetical protein
VEQLEDRTLLSGGPKGPTLSANLSGYEEVPAVSTTGHGAFQATITESAISYELSYADLEGTAIAAHIHLGQKGVNGGVSAFLCGGGGKPACPAAGTVTGTITAADIIGPAGQGIAAGEFAELLQAIDADVTYANVHSTKHPGGEIRGQIGVPPTAPDLHAGVGSTPAGLLAASIGSENGTEPLRSEQAALLLSEALSRWQAAGAATADLPQVEVRIADLARTSGWPVATSSG